MKVEEIDRLGIKELALFPTCLGLEERRELYGLLEGTGLENIPHVHLRDDMENWEFDYLIGRYGTQVFNFHPDASSVDMLNRGEYLDRMYIENLTEIDGIFLDCLEKCAGVCLDVSHWEDQGMIQKNKGYDGLENILQKNKIGCCHISAMNDHFTVWPNYITGKKIRYYSNHKLKDLSELDYVGKYVRYLPEIVSIELGNTFAEQLEIKKYLERIIN